MREQIQTGPTIVTAGDDVIMEQLKQLSSAVDRMTCSSSVGHQGDQGRDATTLTEIQSLRKQVDSLQQANTTVQVRLL